jgi:hypothetical protein
MDAKDRKHLRKLAKLMVAEAQSSENDRVFSATGYAQENISILHQQVRCANLAWALRFTRRVRRGDVIAIAGGSFSGLMLACSLAIAEDVIVYIFERNRRLLDRFLDKGHRHLSPNLNSRYLGVRFNPEYSTPFYAPAIFTWHKGAANEVAHEWLKNFERYQRNLPIFVFPETEIRSENIELYERRIKIKLPQILDWKPIEVDLLIDATGFGEEANPLGLVDYSYWEAGHRLIYDHLPKECRILVSGCGDSGIIEALHYTIKDFRHELVEALWPLGVNLEAHLDLGLERAKLDDLLLSQDVDIFGGKVIPELCWWLEWCRLRYTSDEYLLGTPDDVQSIYEAIDAALQPHLLKSFPAKKFWGQDFRWDKLEAFLCKLDVSSQLQIREAVMPVVDDWISRNMEELVREIPPDLTSMLGELHNSRRAGVSVTLNGITPTPYTRQMSSFNVWLTRVLMTFPNVEYKQGRIAKVEVKDSRHYRVTFDGGGQEVYDRVVTRYGPAPPPGPRLSSKTQPDLHRGNWLLNYASYTVVTKNLTETSHRRGIIEPARDDVARRLKGVLKRRGSRRVPLVNKLLYQSCLLKGSFDFSAGSEYLESDPQVWLSSKLRSGICPSYEETLKFG